MPHSLKIKNNKNHRWLNIQQHCKGRDFVQVEESDIAAFIELCTFCCVVKIDLK